MIPLEFAIKLEENGEKYYREQAEKYKGTEIENIFLTLADDEFYHAEIIRQKQSKEVYDLTDTKVLDESKDIFANADDFDEEVFSQPKQIDALRQALKKEQESIDLYQEMYDDTIEKDEKKLYSFLVKEEKKHYKVINEIIELHRHAEEWVEDAEFGKRDKY
ncbi:MAG: ferritin-like domain-containing protein [Clostridia bacterium]